MRSSYMYQASISIGLASIFIPLVSICIGLASICIGLASSALTGDAPPSAASSMQTQSDILLSGLLMIPRLTETMQQARNSVKGKHSYTSYAAPVTVVHASDAIAPQDLHKVIWHLNTSVSNARIRTWISSLIAAAPHGALYERYGTKQSDVDAGMYFLVVVVSRAPAHGFGPVYCASSRW